jgi:large subunit ribosomal protein L13
MTTFFANKKDYMKDKKWEIIDAQGQVVGRVAARVARILQGKTEATYTPHVETGPGVIVINSAKVIITGNKAKTKLYKNFSGFPGGLRERTYERVMAEDPTFAVKSAVKGMLPKSRLGRSMLTRLLVYAGAEHPHSAQKPKSFSLKG